MGFRAAESTPQPRFPAVLPGAPRALCCRLMRRRLSQSRSGGALVLRPPLRFGASRLFVSDALIGKVALVGKAALVAAKAATRGSEAVALATAKAVAPARTKAALIGEAAVPGTAKAGPVAKTTFIRKAAL